MTSFHDLISPFISSIAEGAIEIYNEFSLQHELGIFLRGRFPDAKVQFERNVSYFFQNDSLFIKREIDISVFSDDPRELRWAVELKFPRNGQHPEQMFSFCKDIAFVEELKMAGFLNAAVLIFADDHLFWRGPTDGIYGFFRGGRPLCGRIQKPTGAKNLEVTLRGNYLVRWTQVLPSLHYTAVEP